MLATANFKETEFYVHEKPPAEVIAGGNLAAVMKLCQWLRSLAGVAGIVTSFYRSPDRNASVGGAEHSQHMKGEAADVIFYAIALRTLASRILDAIAAGTAPAFGQIIVYADAGHVHISMPTLGARNGEVLYSPGTYGGKRVYYRLTTAALVRLPSVSKLTKAGVAVLLLCFSAGLVAAAPAIAGALT